MAPLAAGRVTRPNMAETRVTRIFVSCDTSPLGAAALDAAAVLARQLDAELAGLYVEDANLLRMAALPFACEITLVSALTRRIDVSAVEQALRRQADAMRWALSQAAQALQVPWSFQVARGTLMDILLDELREPGLAVLGHAGQFVMNGQAQSAHASANSTYDARRQPVLTLYDGTAPAHRALGVAIRMARPHHKPVVVMLVANTDVERAQLQARVEAELQGTGIAVHFQASPSRDADRLKKAALTRHAAAVLWPGLSGVNERRALSTLVYELTCPVLLVT